MIPAREHLRSIGGTPVAFVVTCVITESGRDDHYAIIALSVLEDGRRRTMPIDEVVVRIMHGQSFYVRRLGGVVEVAVFGDRYVQARVGGSWTNDLLALPRCVPDPVDNDTP